jgi:histidine triad (HIT) family protein
MSIENNIFYKIINKQEEANIIYENEYVCCFDDIEPNSPVHILIVPKKYIQSMDTIAEEDEKYLSEILLASNKIAKIKNIDKSGYRIISNCNKDGGQEIDYLHFHLVGGCKLGRMIHLPKESKKLMKELNSN